MKRITKYLIVGILLLFLSHIATGDMLLLFLSSIIFFPAIMLIQILIYFVFGKIHKLRRYQGYISLIPAICISVHTLFTMSIWAQPNEIFKLALGMRIPPSVNNFTFQETGFTDCILEFYCEIAPTDLHKIIKKKAFRQDFTSSYSHSLNFKDYAWLKDKPAPINNYIKYKYIIAAGSSKTEGGDCTLYTNKKHNRIFVIYSVD